MFSAVAMEQNARMTFKIGTWIWASLLKGKTEVGDEVEEAGVPEYVASELALGTLGRTNVSVTYYATRGVALT
jgi:hypothetical protein